MQSSNKKGKYSYFCGMCGENCESEAPQTHLQKDRNTLQQLHDQNNELIEHIKYLSKRNDDLNKVIETRLRTEESSLKKERARSNTGIIYRNAKYTGSNDENIDRSYHVKVNAPPNDSRSPYIERRASPKTEAYQIIKSSHLEKELEKSRSRDYTPQKKSIFTLAEGQTDQNAKTLLRNPQKYEKTFERTVSKTPTKQLNYLPIYEQKRPFQPENKVKEPPKHVQTAQVTFRNGGIFERRTKQQYEKAKRRTNQPYLAMLNPSEYPHIYYPHYQQQVQGYPDRQTHEVYTPTADLQRNRLYSHY